MKTKTVTFATTLDDRTFKVVRVTDSLRFIPGEMVSRLVVEDLCREKGWKVLIIERK